MQRLEVSGAVRHIYGSLDFKGLRLNEDGCILRSYARTFQKNLLPTNAAFSKILKMKMIEEGSLKGGIPVPNSTVSHPGQQQSS